MGENRIIEAGWILSSEQVNRDIRSSVRKMCENDVGSEERHPETLYAYCEALDLSSMHLSLYDDGDKEPFLIVKMEYEEELHIRLRSLTQQTLTDLETLRAICES